MKSFNLHRTELGRESEGEKWFVAGAIDKSSIHRREWCRGRDDDDHHPLMSAIKAFDGCQLMEDALLSISREPRLASSVHELAEKKASEWSEESCKWKFQMLWR
jgi:hypothetical protein